MVVHAFFDETKETLVSTLDTLAHQAPRVIEVERGSHEAPKREGEPRKYSGVSEKVLKRGRRGHSG